MAPFGASVCMILAHRRGLNVRYYGAIGAVYTLVYLLPVVYLISRLSGRRLSHWTTAVASFIAWTHWIMMLLFLFVWFSIPINDDTSTAASLAPMVNAVLLLTAALASLYHSPTDNLSGVQDKIGNTLSLREMRGMSPFVGTYLITVVLFLSVRGII